MFNVLLAADTVSWRELIVPTDPVEFWTFAMTIVTVGLGLVAFFGLRSVSLSKADMKNRGTREAAQAAIDHCDQMARVLIPAYLEILEGLRGVPLFVNDPSQVSFEKTEETRKINQAIQWMSHVDRPLSDKTIDFMNRLETWSMSFTHNPSLADERVAFEPCSAVFCQMVMSMYPMLLTQRRMNPASGPYQNIVMLFKGWYAKKAAGDLLDQLKRVQAEGQHLPPTIGN